MSGHNNCQVMLNGNGTEDHLSRKRKRTTTIQPALGAQQSSSFLTEVKVSNIGSVRRKVLREDKLGFVSLTGTEFEKTGGKSTFLVSLMLGLGYDMLPPVVTQTATARPPTRPASSTTMCGLRVDRGIVRTGKKFAAVELTMCLKGYPSLEQEYGSHMTFFRTFLPGKSLRSSVITLSSADPDIGDAINPHLVQTGSELERIYKRMNLSTSSFRLMFLTMENVNHLLDHHELWYTFIEAAVQAENSSDVKLKEMDFLLQRLRHAETRKQMTVDSLRAQIQIHTPAAHGTEVVKMAKRNDEAEFKRCLADLVLTFKDRRELETKRNEYSQELSSALAEACVTRMVFVFNEFLEQLHLCGHIMLRHEGRRVAMCVWDLNAQETWVEFEHVEERWAQMSRGLRLAAMFAFYVSLWDVSAYLPLFAADAFSSTCGDFMIPLSAHPVLKRVLEKKVKEGKQCFVSQPPRPDAPPIPQSPNTRSLKFTP